MMGRRICSSPPSQSIFFSFPSAMIRESGRRATRMGSCRLPFQAEAALQRIQVRTQSVEPPPVTTPKRVATVGR